MDKCVVVWKSGCEVWKTLCGGEGVKINSKIISKKFGGVECLFYFCSVKKPRKTYQWSEILFGLGRCRAPQWRSLNFYISGTCTPVR